VRALYDDPDNDGDPSELWKAVGEQGWLAVTIDEQYDGLGLGLLDAAVLARCWGEGCAPGPFLPTLVAADGGTLWLVDPAGGGVTVTRHDALDRSTRLSTVTFDKVAGKRLSGQVLPDVVDRAAVLYANDLAGIARVALNRTVDYDKTREQFGKPVGSFQALKHALADLHVATTMAEHSGWYAAHALDAHLPDASLSVSVAKAKCSDTARDVTAAMIQFHGGIGYTWEHDAHLFFKRAKREEYQYGDGTFHRERIARLAVDAPRS
jgi:alkylation response protein AidB-like acyl-CoA dehydrogenase